LIFMGRLLEIVTPLHKATKRDYLARMNDDKVHCMVKAKEYEFDYWDGDRRYGYGGYRFIEGRWKPVAQALIDTYGLGNGSKVLDVGCGKAFLLYEMKKLLPGLQVAGFDISRHGLAEAKDEIRPYLYRYRAQDRYRSAASTTCVCSSCRRRCRRSSGSARTSTSWSRATATSASSSTSSAGRSPPSRYCTPPTGSGSTIISAIQATTSSSISNERA
jgi:hypothetical protein